MHDPGRHCGGRHQNLLYSGGRSSQSIKSEDSMSHLALLPPCIAGWAVFHQTRGRPAPGIAI